MPGITASHLTDGALVELYSPSKSLEDDQGIWYEIPKISYPIVSGAHYGVVNQAINRSDDFSSTTPDALIDDSTLFKRVRFNYNNSRLPYGLPTVGSNTLSISGLGTTDADWNGTYDVTGYDIQESYVDVLIDLTGTVGTATTSLTGCINSYVVTNSPAVLIVDAFNAYGRTREMVDNFTTDVKSYDDYYIESLYMNDYTLNSKVSFVSRPAAVLNVKGEKRDKATVIYTEPYIFNTEINGLGRVYPDVNFEEYNHKFGPITKLHTRDDGILVLQERKTSKILVNKQMIYSADGGGSLTTSAQFLSQQIPLLGDYGCVNPESFSYHGHRQWFADAINGAVIVVEGDSLQDVAVEGMSRWFRSELLGATSRNYSSPNTYKVQGCYDPSYEEYVLSFRHANGSGTFYTLAFSLVSKSWVSFFTYNPQLIVNVRESMFIISGQNVFISFPGLPGKLLGVYYDSILEFVSNIEHGATKNFFAVDLDANKAPYRTVIENSAGQSTRIETIDWVEREDYFQAPILRDVNTPDITSNKLLYGDTIKSKSINLKMEFANAVQDGVEINGASVLVSKA
jgi:hypothetical protein